MKGIITDQTGTVKYKFDTKEPPQLAAGEKAVFREDINNIHKGAAIAEDGSYTNPQAPEPTPTPLQVAISGIADTTLKNILERIRKGEV